MQPHLATLGLSLLYILLLSIGRFGLVLLVLLIFLVLLLLLLLVLSVRLGLGLLVRGRAASSLLGVRSLIASRSLVHVVQLMRELDRLVLRMT